MQITTVEPKSILKFILKVVVGFLGMLFLFSFLFVVGLFGGWLFIISVPLLVLVVAPLYFLFSVFAKAKKVRLTSTFQTTVETIKKIGQNLAKKFGHPVAVCLCVMDAGATSRTTVHFDGGETTWDYIAMAPNHNLSATKLLALLEDDLDHQVNCSKHNCETFDFCPKRKGLKKSAELIYSDRFTD